MKKGAQSAALEAPRYQQAVPIAVNRELPVGIAVVAAATLVVGLLATPYMAAATTAYGLLTLGLYFRKQRSLHARLMGAAIGTDLAVLLVVELQRDAIKTAASLSLSGWQQAHIAFSTLAVVSYIPVAVLGVSYLLNRGAAKGRKWHMRLGVLAYACRTLGFILMFAMLDHVQG